MQAYGTLIIADRLFCTYFTLLYLPMQRRVKFPLLTLKKASIRGDFFACTLHRRRGSVVIR